MFQRLKWIFLVLLSLVLAFVALVYFSTFHPAPVEQVNVISVSKAPKLSPSQTIKVLSWNVQFMAGNKNNHFFYDDGLDPWPTAETVESTTTQVADFIKSQDPDVVLLQEVDDIATRTHKRDQTQALMKMLPEYPVLTETFYWKAAYVPHPQINGRVGMKLVILSKYKIDSATRYALPMITTDDILRRQFNLKRAMLEVSLPIENGGQLIMINTHLSAFAKGSDTMERQIETVKNRIENTSSGTPWIIGGDFNLLPSLDAIKSFKDGRNNYNSQNSELTPLISKYPSVPSLSDINQNPEPWYTYTPPSDPERNPDRTIDYIFYSPNLQVQSAQVVREGALPLSDHLPIVAEYKLP